MKTRLDGSVGLYLDDFRCPFSAGIGIAGNLVGAQISSAPGERRILTHSGIRGRSTTTRPILAVFGVHCGRWLGTGGEDLRFAVPQVALRRPRAARCCRQHGRVGDRASTRALAEPGDDHQPQAGAPLTIPYTGPIQWLSTRRGLGAVDENVSTVDKLGEYDDRAPWLRHPRPRPWLRRVGAGAAMSIASWQQATVSPRQQ